MFYVCFFQNKIVFGNIVIFFNFKFIRFVGHCVEFNLLGGVIQDQLLSPCKETFPKCDVNYNSTVAYKCNTTVYIIHNCRILKWSFKNKSTSIRSIMWIAYEGYWKSQRTVNYDKIYSVLCRMTYV